MYPDNNQPNNQPLSPPQSPPQPQPPQPQQQPPQPQQQPPQPQQYAATPPPIVGVQQQDSAYYQQAQALNNVNSAYSQPPKGSGGKKKLFIIMGIVAGIIFLSVIVGVLIFFLMGVTKGDYNKAYTLLGETRDAYNKVGDEYMSRPKTQSEVDSKAKNIDKLMKEFSSKFDELGKSKAVLLDGELRDKYNTIKEEKKKFEKVEPVLRESHIKIMAAFDMNKDDVKGAVEDLKSSLGSLKYDANKQFVEEALGYLKEMQSLESKIKSGKNYDSSLITKYYDFSDKYSDATKKWKENIANGFDDAKMVDEFSDFSKLLTDKEFKKSKE